MPCILSNPQTIYNIYDLNLDTSKLASAVLHLFFIMKAFGHDVGLSSSQLLRGADQLWHELILDTRKYRDFCAPFEGGFIHHTQTIGSDESAQAAERQFIELYESDDFKIYNVHVIDEYITNFKKPETIEFPLFWGCG
jgi:hypothetical protein